MALNSEKIDGDWSKINWDEFAKFISDKQRIEKLQRQRVETFIKKLSPEHLEKWITKFLDWERKYEQFRYTYRHEESESNLFCAVISYCQKNGRISKNYHEEFLTGAFAWNGYIFKLYRGQGSFWIIMKRKKIIFQSR